MFFIRVIKSIYYFFPIQLFLIHFKRYQVLLFFWMLLLGYVTKQLAYKFGVPYLFLYPEYLDKVNFWSYFILGISMGSFIIAFNISSYIENGYKFPFIATLSRPFFKYTINNFIIPLIFIITYIVYSLDFQVNIELIEQKKAVYHILGFLAGMLLFVVIALTYFFSTNKDIFRMFKMTKDDEQAKKKGPIKMILQKDMEWKMLNSPKSNTGKDRVETYLITPYRIKRARDIMHYSPEMITNVLNQNHNNAAVFAILLTIIFILLGFFMDNQYFMIPSGASIILLLTIFLLFISALRTALRQWLVPFLAAFIIIVSAIWKDIFVNYQNNAYGLSYNKEVHIPVDSAYYTSLDTREDYQSIIKILEKWKEKNMEKNFPFRKPKIIFINTSGGGLKASIWSYYSLSYADSVLEGELFNKCFLITGASGGMIGAAYLRELYLRMQQGEMEHYYHDTLLTNLSKDLLNPIAFSLAVNDWFIKFRKFEYKGHKYFKDRAYAFENKFNRNTNAVMDKPLGAYRLPEAEAIIPIMIFAPTVINDGNKLLVSAQDLSFLMSSTQNNIESNYEFRKLYKKVNADKLRFTTILRMNSTFPYVLPTVSLPGDPQLNVMDAGIRDNYGLSTSLQFLFAFKDWINANTSGVIFIQIADELSPSLNYDITAGQKFLQPFSNVYTNLFNMQYINNEQLIEFSKNWVNKIEFVNLYLVKRAGRISISWHLTRKEKQRVLNLINSSNNQKEILRLKELLK